MTTFHNGTEPDSASSTAELIPHQSGPPADQDTLPRPNPAFPGDEPDE